MFARPGTQVTQLAGEPRVLRANDGGDLTPQPLRERRRSAAGGNGDGDRVDAMHGGQDQTAELGIVGDVAEDPEPLGVLLDPTIHPAIRRRRDREPLAAEVPARITALDPFNGQVEQLGDDLRRSDGDARAALEQSARLLEPDVPTSDDDAVATGQVEAGHVVAHPSYGAPRASPQL